MARDLLTTLLLIAAIDFGFSADECANSQWTYFNGACYFFIKGKMAYLNARANCVAMGYNATLVTVHSAEEQEFLNTKYGGAQYWLGLEANFGAWSWLDGLPYDYKNWETNPAAAKCPVVNFDVPLGKWSTILCTRKNLPSQGLLCKYYTPKPTVPTTTVPTTTTTEPCNDKDEAPCTDLAPLCQDPMYSKLMAEQCTRTCHRCPSDDPPATCSDKDDAPCGQLVNMCDSAIFHDFMTAECPKTCNRCPPPCLDKVTAPCDKISYLCGNAAHHDLLAVECPRTCGFCTP